jgi:serine/threonine protein kinase
MKQTHVTKDAGVNGLLESLKESKLLSAEEIDRAAKSASDSGMDASVLAQSLIANGILTAFQMEAVQNRKFEQLHIGNYEVLDRLGAGGMGTVFKARHGRMKRIVALKVLSRTLADEDESFVRRFQREVETIARLNHPNIVMAYDADEADVGPFLVMEYINGRDLAHMVEEDGPLAVNLAVDYILQAARGLEYAHSQGIIHRDIKPANLLRDATGVIKLTDLGVARLNNPDSAATVSGITQTGGILGSVHYMAPEQAVDSTQIDFRADIYSLAATFHFLLVGQQPYQGQTMMAVLLKHRDAPIPSLTKVRADVPPVVDAVFRRMMAKAPDDRYQTMAEVVRVLEAVKASLDAAPAPGTGVPTSTIVVKPSASASQALDTSLAGAPDATQGTISMRPLATPEGLHLKVLLVEPSRAQSGIIRSYLQAQGIRDIVKVASGQEAFQSVRTNVPDAIVCAMHLPDMTGIQLAQRIRAETKSAALGFVLISSEAESAEAGSLSKCGNAVLLHKPFTAEKLREALTLVSDQAQSAKSTRGKLRVLIVDDSTPARLHIRRVLKGLGLSQFVEAADGAQAVAATTTGTFDVIVTDYNMPFMDGRGLVGYLKQNPATASVPIIMVTTETDSAKLEAVRQLGVAAVCEKSFPPEVVENVIDQLLRKP